MIQFFKSTIFAKAIEKCSLRDLHGKHLRILALPCISWNLATGFVISVRIFENCCYHLTKKKWPQANFNTHRTFSLNPRDVLLTKKVWECIQKMAILTQLQIHFKAKHEKGLGTPFPRVPAPLHSCLTPIMD